MDVTRFKKVSSIVGGFALAMAISAPASAAWTQVPIPAEYASSISSLRLCKSQIQVPFAGALWRVRSELTRFNTTVSVNTLTVRRFVGSTSYLISVFPSNSFDSTNTARVTAYGSTTQDDRFFPIVTFSTGSSYQFPALVPAQIANC